MNTAYIVILSMSLYAFNILVSVLFVTIKLTNVRLLCFMSVLCPLWFLQSLLFSRTFSLQWGYFNIIVRKEKLSQMSCMCVYTWPVKLIVIGTVLQLYMHETWCEKLFPGWWWCLYLDEAMLLWVCVHVLYMYLLGLVFYCKQWTALIKLHTK